MIEATGISIHSLSRLSTIIAPIEAKGILGNINAQHAYGHVDLPSEVKVYQIKLSLIDPAGLAAWVGMVHYISTLPGESGQQDEKIVFAEHVLYSYLCLHHPQYRPIAPVDNTRRGNREYTKADSQPIAFNVGGHTHRILWYG